MHELIICVLISTFMVLLTCALFYEIMKISLYLLADRTISRIRVLIVVLVIFTGHTLAVWLYGGAYYAMQHYYALGEIKGDINGQFIDYVYYSAATYSSLGIGDVFPTKSLRFLTGVEVLNGLILIAWSASFIYLVMEKIWGKK